MERNILYIAYSYPPAGGNGLPGAQRIVKFVRYLNCKNTHVLTVKPDHYPEYIILDNDIELPVNNEIIHRTKVIDIFKIFLKIKESFRYIIRFSHKTQLSNTSPENKTGEIWYKRGNRSRWQQMKDFVSDVFYFPDNCSPWIIPAVFRGLKVIRQYKITVIFATGSPWSALAIGYFLSRLTNIPLVVDFRDPWMENPFHISKGKLLDGLAVRLEKAIVRHARLVSANTEELRDAFIRRYPDGDSKKFITLPNGYDINDFQYLSQTTEPARNIKPEKDLVLAHAGFLYGTRDPFPVIEAIKNILRTKGRDINIIFWQIGKISLNYDLKEKYKDLIKANSVVLVDQLPYNKCLEKLTQADILLNIQPKTLTQVPSKIYDYLCMNLPILTITPIEGALWNMIRRYDFGYVFAPDDIEGISSCILQLWQEKQKEGRLTAGYLNRELFNIRKIAYNLSESLKNVGC